MVEWYTHKCKWSEENKLLAGKIAALLLEYDGNYACFYRGDDPFAYIIVMGYTLPDEIRKKVKRIIPGEASCSRWIIGECAIEFRKRYPFVTGKQLLKKWSNTRPLGKYTRRKWW